MTLYLVRHGKARKGGKDRQRPLMARGINDLKSVAAFLKRLRLPVSQIWHSDRVRAMETARMVAPAVVLSGKMLERPGLGPGDSVDAAIRQIKNVRGDLMIVGHQPFLGKLASKLLKQKSSDEIVKLPTSSVLALASEDGKWAVAWLLPPVLVSSGKSPDRGKPGRPASRGGKRARSPATSATTHSAAATTERAPEIPAASEEFAQTPSAAELAEPKPLT